MANMTLPPSIAVMICGLRSNVPTIVPLGTELSAAEVTSGLRPSSASVLGFALKYAAIFCCVPGRSDVAFGMTRLFVEPLNVFFAPAARWVSPELLASWMITTRFFAPAAVNCLPAPSPASSSVWPTCTSYVGSESNAPRPELTVMISIPFFEAFVSGSLSALASGTEVAITFAPALIAALMPATCFATSLLAYTCVVVTPRLFRSFVAWSTPRLNTDQNEPVSPCVTTATLIGEAVKAPKAAAGEPSAASPAAAAPPFTKRPRRVTCSTAASSAGVACFSIKSPLSWGVRTSRRFSTSGSDFASRDRSTGRPGSIGGDRSHQRRPRLAEAARALAAASRGVDERLELGAVGVGEAIDEAPVAVARVLDASLDGAERRAAVEADADAVAGTEHLEPDVVAERVVARPGQHGQRAAGQPQDRGRRVDVVVAAEPRRLPHRAAGVDLLALEAGDEAIRVEIVDVQVAEDAAGTLDICLRRRRRVMRRRAGREHGADGAVRDRGTSGAVAVIEAALEPDLDERACAVDVGDHGVELGELERHRLLAERRQPRRGGEPDERRVRGSGCRDDQGVDAAGDELFRRLGRFGADRGGHALGGGAVDVCDREAYPFEPRQRAGVNGADAPRSDEADVHVNRCQAPWCLAPWCLAPWCLAPSGE